MIRALVAIAAAAFRRSPGKAADWVLQTIPAAGPVKVIETLPDGPVVLIGAGWFRVHADGNRYRLVATAGPSQLPLPLHALPDGIIAEGSREVARAWLADPTNRYDHGVLGDAIEAESVVVERRDGRRDVVTLSPDAVFEDLRPRIAPLGGSDKVVVVKSYLARGSALAVIGERNGRYRDRRRDAADRRAAPLAQSRRHRRFQRRRRRERCAGADAARGRPAGALELSQQRPAQDAGARRRVEPRQRLAGAAHERGRRLRRRRPPRSRHCLVRPANGSG